MLLSTSSWQRHLSFCGYALITGLLSKFFTRVEGFLISSGFTVYPSDGTFLTGSVRKKLPFVIHALSSSAISLLFYRITWGCVDFHTVNFNFTSFKFFIICFSYNWTAAPWNSVVYNLANNIFITYTVLLAMSSFKTE